MIKVIKQLALFLVVVLSTQCTRQQDSGNSIETENCIAFVVTSPDGSPSKNARIQILPIWYVADSSSNETKSEHREIITNENGIAYLDSLPEGIYRTTTIFSGMGASREIEIHHEQSKQLNIQLELSPVGTIQGKMNLPAKAAHAWIQIFGTNIIVQTDSAGNFSIDSLPASTYRIKAIVANSLSAIGEDLVQVRSGSIVEALVDTSLSPSDEDLATWKYRRQIPLDTLVSTWMQPLPYPCVITMRLDSSNFSFDEAMIDGRDIRFSDSYGNRIPFRKTYWNREQGKGTFQIKLEDSLSIDLGVLLYWGKPGAQFMVDDDVWNGISDSLFLAWNTILLDDFEDTLPRTALPAPIPRHDWYLNYSDTSVKSTPSPSEGLFSAFQPALDSREGSAMHFSYKAPTPKWIQVGTGLGGGPRSFRTLDSIVYWVKGNGNYTLAFDKLVGNQGKAVYEDPVPNKWTRIRLRPSDLDSADGEGGNIGWEAICDSVTNLTLFFYNGTDFWIDDIHFYGINRDDLK